MTQITDSDREERNSLLKLIYCMGDDNDCWRIDQAFARHRIQALSTQSAELEALRGEVERLTGENFLLAAGACINPNGIGLMGDEHGNSFCEVERERIKLDEQVTDLMATIAQLRDRVAKFAEILETVLPYTEAERLREEADVRCGRTYRNPIQKAVNKARALLTQNEVG